MTPNRPPFADILSVICAKDEPSFSDAQAFSSDFNLPLFCSVQESGGAKPYALVFQGASVSLIQAPAREGNKSKSGKKKVGAISASFFDGKVQHRKQFGGGKGQLIAKAVGLKSGVIPEVVDATAGLGRDAFVLAGLGCRVKMLEQSPVIAKLLSSATRELHELEPNFIDQLTFEEGNSIDWLSRQEDHSIDVVYLDPMYPHNDKSALVKKEMQAFHDLVGPAFDEEELLDLAIRKAKYRVAVKRPRKGEAIKGPEPSVKLEGKTSRYDIYARLSMKKDASDINA